MRSLSTSRPTTRRLALAALAAVALSACASGVTSLVGPADVEQAVVDAATRSRSVTVRTVAVLDAAELGELRELHPEAAAADPRSEVERAADVARLQLALDRSSVQLDTAEDGSRRAALRWDDEVAVDVRVAAPDAAAAGGVGGGAPARPVDVTVSTRLDVGVLLQMVLALHPDTSPADLLELRGDLAEAGGTPGEGAAAESAPVVRALLAGDWVTMTGTIDPVDHDGPTGQGGPHPTVDATGFEALLSSALTFSAPTPATAEGQTATVDLDAGAMGEVLRELLPPDRHAAADGLAAVMEGLVLDDLWRLAFDAEGQLGEGRLDVLSALRQTMSHRAVQAADASVADQARQVAEVLDGWSLTTVEVVAAVTDHGQIATLTDDVDPTVTIDWAQAHELIGAVAGPAGPIDGPAHSYRGD